HTQPVELDLTGFEGVEPVELFGRSRFPAIGPGLYLLTIGPHDFFWFGLDRAEGRVDETAGPPRVTIRGELAGVFHAREQLDRVLLAAIEDKRWFRGKAQTISGGHIVDRVDLPGTNSMIAFLQVDYVEQGPEVYAWPIALASGFEAVRRLLETPVSVIAEVHSASGTGVLYDATSDPDFGSVLVDLAANRRKLKGRATTLAALPIAASRHLTAAIEGQLARPGGAEQSNTSIVLGDQVIVKMMRRVDAGPNPEVEVGRFLTERAGFEHTAPLLGALEVSMNGKAAAFAVVHRYIPNQGDAWSHTLTSLSLTYEQVAARRAELGRPPAPIHPLDIGDEELDAVRGLAGVLLHEAALLGQRTGEMHLALVSVPDDPDFAPQPLTTLYQRSLYQSTRSSIRT
ncbi:MAG TPA: alpha-glucosidase C-terminal domain-containing protein, partial [Acidimicrobiia bacterium]|nr:alpha-glucosidase C-terminal domain-containing protein [Acidimicrobiia bacterium]